MFSSSFSQTGIFQFWYKEAAEAICRLWNVYRFYRHPIMEICGILITIAFTTGYPSPRPNAQFSIHAGIVDNML